MKNAIPEPYQNFEVSGCPVLCAAMKMEPLNRAWQRTMPYLPYAGIKNNNSKYHAVPICKISFYIYTHIPNYMLYKRMPIEKESPEEKGYDTIFCIILLKALSQIYCIAN